MLRRELYQSQNDATLLALERMRMIDCAHKWATGTWAQYKSHFNRLTSFERLFQVTILPNLNLTIPPSSTAITGMWAMQHYVLQSPRGKPTERIKYNTARGLRSATYLFHEIQATLKHPHTATKDLSTDHYRLSPGTSPSDALAYTHMSTGMSRRLGTATSPSKAITFEMIWWNEIYRERVWKKLSSQKAPPRQLYDVAASASAEILSFLGWLRGTECFSLQWDDIDITPPHLGPTQGLKRGLGMIQLFLQHATKTSQTKRADVVIAYQTYGGLQPGKWIKRLFILSLQLGYHESFLFQQVDGTPWTSSYYRHNILIPLLLLQRQEGNLILQKLHSPDPISAITTAFWSWHSYRRGGRTHVSINHPLASRLATRDEVLEHGRWRHQSTGDLPLHYQEWEFPTRLNITALCY